jgi:hypothetical protein
MKNNFLIDMLPVKHGKQWTVSVCDSELELDSVYVFAREKDAQLFIDGWVACIETHNLSK